VFGALGAKPVTEVADLNKSGVVDAGDAGVVFSPGGLGALAPITVGSGGPFDTDGGGSASPATSSADGVGHTVVPLAIEAVLPAIGLPVRSALPHRTLTANQQITLWSMPLDRVVGADVAAPARTVAVPSGMHDALSATAAAIRLADAHHAAYFVDAFGTDDGVSIGDTVDEDLLDLLLGDLGVTAWHRL